MQPSRLVLTCFAILLLITIGCTPAADAPLPTLAAIAESANVVDSQGNAADARNAAPEATAHNSTESGIPQLIAWQTETGTLENAAALDVWQFNGQADETIRLRVVERGGTPATMQLFGPDGQALAAGADIRADLALTGVYRVEVSLTAASGAGGYEIGLSYPDRPNPNSPQVTPPAQRVGVPTPTPVFAGLGTFISQITPNDEISARLTSDDPVHVYTLAGNAGQAITLDMQARSGSIDPLLMLYDADGVALALDDNTGSGRDARLRDIRLPQDGLYSVQVSGDGFTGEYALRFVAGPQASLIKPSPTPTPPNPTPYLTPTIAIAGGNSRLQAATPQSGTLQRAGDFARFSIPAEAGQELAIGVAPLADSGLRPAFELYDLDGRLIASARASTSNDRGAAFTRGVRIAEDGVYTLIVTGEDNTRGAYLVRYGVGLTIADVYRGEPQPDTRVAGAIDYRGLRDVWRLVLLAGEAINVAVTPTLGTLDPVVELADNAGNVLVSDDNGGGGRNALLRLARVSEDGVYWLRVRDASSDGTGTYTLIWREAGRTDIAPEAVPEVPIMTVDDRIEINEYGFYPFQGRQGQFVTVRVTAQPDTTLDPVLALLGPDGSVLVEADDSNGTLNPEVSALLPVDGTYSVRVNGYLSAGAFDLTVTTR